MKSPYTKLRNEIKRIIREMQDEELDETTFTGNVDGYNIPGAFKKTDGKDEDDEPDSAHTKKLNQSTGYVKVNEKFDPYNIMTLGSKDVFKQRTKDLGMSNIKNLIKFTKSNGGSVEEYGDDNFYATTRESERKNQMIWKYDGLFLYFNNKKVNSSKFDNFIMKLIYPDAGIGESVLSENRWAKLRSDESKTPKQKIGLGIREIKTQLTEIENFLKWYNKIKLENDIAPTDYWKRTNKNLAKIRERVNNITSLIRDLNR